MFLTNTWYVACRTDEVQDKPLGRMICNENMVFFRNQQGEAVALQNFCPHRGAPLSLGSVTAEGIMCGYHGLVVGCDGRTASMPCQRVQGFPSVKKFPTIERYGFIWVWPGDADKAQEELLPKFQWTDNSQWGYGGGLYHIKCDYRLMIDNLMDLTHETYVHASSIGQKEIDHSAPKTTVEGDHVITSRYMENVYAPPFWQMALRSNDLADDVLVDRWQICHFTPPSHIMIEVGVAHAGHGGYHADPKYKVSSVVVDFITPETDKSILYFWGMARDFKPHDASLTAKIQEGQGNIFAEDLDMLESQQRNLDAYPDKKLLMLNIDSGGVQARKVIERLLKQENSVKG